MKTYTVAELQEILKKHKAWAYGESPEGRADLGRADLGGADLRGAYLRGAYLRGAYLGGAYLGGAYLGGAYLGGAYLGGAYLGGAYLGGAYLGGAYLGGAYLGGAYLGGADLRRAYLGDKTTLGLGDSWRGYLLETLPALLTAGGKAIQELIDGKAWDCHMWDNCPMAQAFNVHSMDKCPVLLRPRVEEFIQMFDAKLIPLEVIQGLAQGKEAGEKAVAAFLERTEKEAEKAFREMREAAEKKK